MPRPDVRLAAAKDSEQGLRHQGDNLLTGGGGRIGCVWRNQVLDAIALFPVPIEGSEKQELLGVGVGRALDKELQHVALVEKSFARKNTPSHHKPRPDHLTNSLSQDLHHGALPESQSHPHKPCDVLTSKRVEGLAVAEGDAVQVAEDVEEHPGGASLSPQDPLNSDVARGMVGDHASGNILEGIGGKACATQGRQALLEHGCGRPAHDEQWAVHVSQKEVVRGLLDQHAVLASALEDLGNLRGIAQRCVDLLQPRKLSCEVFDAGCFCARRRFGKPLLLSDLHACEHWGLIVGSRINVEDQLRPATVLNHQLLQCSAVKGVLHNQG